MNFSENKKQNVHYRILRSYKDTLHGRVTGFEPTASWSRTKRATNCATPRKKSAATLLLRLGMRESNSHKRSQSPSHYHYANPHCMFVKKLCFRAALNA